jgi:hypothetical protein
VLDFPGHMGGTGISGRAGANGYQRGVGKGGEGRHRVHPFLLADNPILVEVEVAQEHVHILDRKPVTGIAPGQLRPQDDRKVFRHLVPLDLVVVIAVEFVDGSFPACRRVQRIVSSPTQRRGTGKQEPSAGDGNPDRFLRETAGPPELRARGPIVSGQPFGAQDDQLVHFTMPEDHGRGPAGLEQRSRLLPDRRAGVALDGQQTRGPATAIQNQDDFVLIQDG